MVIARDQEKILMTIYKRMAELAQYEADAHSVIKIHNLSNAFHDHSNSPKDN